MTHFCVTHLHAAGLAIGLCLASQLSFPSLSRFLPCWWQRSHKFDMLPHSQHIACSLACQQRPCPFGPWTFSPRGRPHIHTSMHPHKSITAATEEDQLTARCFLTFMISHILRLWQTAFSILQIHSKFKRWCLNNCILLVLISMHFPHAIPSALTPIAHASQW